MIGIAVAAVLIGLANAQPASATCATRHYVDPATGSYVTRVVCRSGSKGRPARQRRQISGPSHLEPRLRSDANLGACIYSVSVPGPADPRANDLGIIDAILAVVPPCAGADLGRVRPTALASDFWARTPMPRPSPTINPSDPVTGRDAFLVVGTPLDRLVTQPTPLGPLTIKAKGRASVDWGDGSTTTAPEGDAGGPHPSGRIRHVYAQRGAVPLTVSITWRATWSLAGESGGLPLLRTTATITPTVREIQAVITG